jgi:ubiquitin-like 1-activating enzyme E1 B
LSGEVKIPTKPKKTPAPEANGHGVDNASRQQSELVGEVVPAKRSHPEGPEDAMAVKKAKTVAASAAEKDDGVIDLDDSAGGAIVIDDD